MNGVGQFFQSSIDNILTKLGIAKIQSAVPKMETERWINPNYATPTPTQKSTAKPQRQVQAQQPQQQMPTATPTPITPPVPYPTFAPEDQSDPFRGVGPAYQPPDLYRDLILRAAQDKNVPASLLAALLSQESGYNPMAIGQADPNDRGMGMISRTWHPEVTDEQAFDPEFAVPWTADSLSRHMENLDDVNRGLAAYNVGGSGAKNVGDTPSGLGPRGQTYIDNVSRRLLEEYIQELGLLPR